ncbi:MAG: DUF2953 domain-containing protein [Chitinispirillales bacterium]|jgi:hypothetical protein|nr:DUF2953 domain-containing protein [Chitinispirillales bacterium]
MWTILLWIFSALLSLVILLIILPIRFGANVNCRNPRRLDSEFRLSYIHQNVFQFVYSSKKGISWKIFCISLKLKRKKGDEPNGENFEAGEEEAEDTLPQMSTQQGADEGFEEHPQYPDEDAGSQSYGLPPSVDEPAFEEESEKKSGFFQKLKRRWEKIRNSKYYKLINDTVWRKKAFKWMQRLLTGALKIITFDDLRFWVRVGLKNPARLGKLCGYFAAARSALELRSRRIDFVMEPVFMKECLEFEIQLKGRTSVCRGVLWFFAVLLTFPWFRTYIVCRWRGRQKAETNS